MQTRNKTGSIEMWSTVCTALRRDMHLHTADSQHELNPVSFNPLLAFRFFLGNKSRLSKLLHQPSRVDLHTPLKSFALHRSLRRHHLSPTNDYDGPIYRFQWLDIRGPANCSAMAGIESIPDIPISGPEAMVGQLGASRRHIHEPHRVQHRRPVQEPPSPVFDTHSVVGTVHCAKPEFPNLG